MSKSLSLIFSRIVAASFKSAQFVCPGIKKPAPAISSKSLKSKKKSTGGFSLLELIISMSITLILLGITAVSFSRAVSTRERESSRTDALTAAQAAINVMSREISNAGYGLTNNGIVLADSGTQKLHIRANIKNDNLTTTDADEDITYYYDPTSRSVVRYDANATPSTSGIINEVSMVTFQYFDYTDSNSTPVVGLTPTANTGRVRITLIVFMADVNGQPTGQTVTFTSDVTLRNSTYMLNQY
jgi:type II secretory pathway pseudopilin PulG